MTFDGVMTKAVVDELNRRISGGHVKKINQIGEHRLVFQFYANGENSRLLLSSESSSPRIHLTRQTYENPAVPPNFCMLLRKHIGQAKLEEVRQVGLDRTVFFIFQTYNELGDPCRKHLIVEMMGKHSNIILAEEDGKIIEAIRRVSHDMSRVRQIYPGKQYEIFPSDKADILENDQDVRALARLVSPQSAVSNLLQRTITGFSPAISREICFRAEVDGDLPVGALTEEDFSRLQAELERVEHDVREDRFEPASYAGLKPDCYCLALTHRGEPERRYDSVSEAVDAFVTTHQRDDRLGQHRRALKEKLETARRKKAHKLDDLRHDYAETEEREIYKEEGDLLAANVYRLKKGDSEAVVDDFFAGGAPREISLDPKKSPWENVEAKYKRHSKLKRARSILDETIPALEREVHYLDQLRMTIDDAETLEEIEEIRRECEDEGLVRPPKKSRKKERNPKPTEPMRFLSADGATIYVGRNNQQNDRLTLKIADKNDWFFHAKIVPGAHVILKPKGPEPTEDDIRAASWLAAVHSSLRAEDAVDIDCTQKKNVYKQKGAKPGMVFYNDYRTIRASTEKPERPPVEQ